MMNVRVLKIGLLLTCLVSFSLAALWMRECYLVARKIREDHRSEAKLADLEWMLMLYHDQHGAFPPTKYQLKPGGPIHSWRVLLVPHTSQRYIKHFSHYDFSQEWNSTNNLQALDRMPGFDCFGLGGDGGIAHYLAIGDDDEWPSEMPLKSRLITKGKDRFLLVLDPDSKIHWMEPKY